MTAALQAGFERWQRIALLAGAGGLGIWLISAFFTTARAFQAYWFAWIFWAGLAFGALILLMLRFLARGAWGDPIERPSEAAVMTLPLMALLIIPAFFGMQHIFAWARPDAFAGHDWPHKRAYLQVGWFIIRALCYFALLFGVALLMRVWAGVPEGNPGAAPRIFSALRALSGLGALGYFFCMEFASTDWVLSLEPEWYSTMFVVIFAASQFLSALALMTVFVTLLARREPYEAQLTTKQLHDLGNLLLAFVIFWAYVSFSQFMLIWMGNLPREIGWYLHRSAGGWPWLALLLAVFQFAIPFALLLSRAAKRHHQSLAPIAALIFLANILNVYWHVIPSVHAGAMGIPWLEAAVFIGLGGLWTGAFLFFVRRRALIPLHLKKEVLHG